MEKNSKLARVAVEDAGDDAGNKVSCMKKTKKKKKRVPGVESKQGTTPKWTRNLLEANKTGGGRPPFCTIDR